MAPKFWMDGSRLTMTFFRAMVSAPLARLTVTIIGSISGVRPTAIERPKSSASTQLPLVRPTMRKTAQTMTTMKRIISQVNDADAPVEAGLLAPLGQAAPRWPRTGCGRRC